MDKIRISAVRYANTFPFIYGLSESGFDKKVILETDHPADCASKVMSGKVDLGLIPVAVIPLLKESHIISNYCIGANNKVRTVQLMSNSDFNDIETVYLDYRSKTSVNLVKVLAMNKWKKHLNWVSTSEGFDFVNIEDKEAVVMIGDQCFEFEKHFMQRIDLAEEWKKFSGLPFVFACWTSNRQLDDNFVEDFNAALETGVKNIDAVVERFGRTGSITGRDLKVYLTENIDFDFNDEKKKGMKLFFKLLRQLQ
jgi:chorismate dehydratase